MKLFDIKKFNFDADNKSVITSHEMDIPVTDSAFIVCFEIEINHSEIIQKLESKKNTKIKDNVVSYYNRCANNEIVISVYDFVERNHANDSIIIDLEKIIDVLNVWTKEE